MIGIPVALVYSNLGEWLIHKHVLHGLGKRPGNFFAHHWEHHRAVRANGFRDPAYELPALRWHPPGKELLGLAMLAAVHGPLFPAVPFFTATVWWKLYDYWRTHRRAHLDPDWARANIPWHWDHHMGPKPNANWCVTRPWFDDLLGTRS
jgi:hypothetical protein